ncbi:MAG TPA: hypothetical protein VN903_16730 [Polyangia bacterium]|nr:hypothetical protein [Polyangia bacterium]
MPLLEGHDSKTISHNIRELKINRETGEERPLKQRIAIAMSEARKSKRKAKKNG